MLTKRAYRYRVYPTAEQARNLAQTFGCVRFVYNWALHTRKRAYFDHGVKLTPKDLSAAIPALKKAEGTAWLREVSSVPLQQALRHLDSALIPITPSSGTEPRLPLPSRRNRSQLSGHARSQKTAPLQVSPSRKTGPGAILCPFWLRKR